MNEIEGFEERLAVVERELEVVVRAIGISGPAETLANVRREMALAERSESFATMGGSLVVTEIGSGRAAVFEVPGGPGVAAVVHRRVRGGDVQSTDLEPHEFDSLVDAVAFLDLGEDASLTLKGAAAGGGDVEIELAQAADVSFRPADEAAEVPS